MEQKMLAFIIAGIVVVLTVGVCLLEAFASDMSDSPSASADVNASIPWHFGVGLFIAAAIAGSHWFPHIGW